MRPLGAAAAATASGVLVAMAYPPLGWSGLAWVALVPLWLALHGRSPRAAFGLGGLSGAVTAALVTGWMHRLLAEHTAIPSAGVVVLQLAMAALLGTTTGLFAAGVRWAAMRGLSPVWTAPAWWVVTEWLRGPAGLHFPWAPLGGSQPAGSAVAQVAELTGTAGVSALVVLVNAALGGALLAHGGSRALARVAITAALVASVAAFGRWRLADLAARPAAGRLRVGVVQGHVEQAVKWEPTHRERILRAFERYTATLWAARPDVIVWPETAMPAALEDDPGGLTAVQRLAREGGVPLVLGSPATERSPEGRRRRFNRVYVLDAAATITARYDKRVLVPFGEYVPFAAWLPWVRPVVTGEGGFSAGGRQEPLAAGGARLGPLLCYESAFGALGRELVRGGATVLVNVSNDGWFAGTAGPEQALAQAAWRAVETRRPLVRVANSGISAAVDASGRIAWRPPAYRFHAEVVEVEWLGVETVYVRWGEWFVAAMAVILAARLGQLR